MIGMLLKQMKYWNVLEKKVMEWRWERLWLSSCCGNHWREWGAWQSRQSWSQQHILCLSSASLSHTFLLSYTFYSDNFLNLSPHSELAILTNVSRHNTSLDPLSLALFRLHLFLSLSHTFQDPSPHS